MSNHKDDDNFGEAAGFAAVVGLAAYGIKKALKW